MPVDWSEVVQLLSTLAEQADMKVAVKETVKGTVIVASCTAVCGLVGGPVGLAVGGTVGGLAATWYCSGRYKPACLIIRDMSDAEKRALYGRVAGILASVEYSDIKQIQAAVNSDEAVREQLLRAITEHMESALHMQVAIRD